MHRSSFNSRACANFIKFYGSSIKVSALKTSPCTLVQSIRVALQVSWSGCNKKPKWLKSDTDTAPWAWKLHTRFASLSQTGQFAKPSSIVFRKLFMAFPSIMKNHQQQKPMSLSLKLCDDYLFGIQKNRNFHSHHCQSHVRAVQSSNRAIIVRVQVYLSGIEKKNLLFGILKFK